MNPAYLACGGWLAAAVGVAAELGIADLVQDEPQPIASLAAATGSDTDVLRRVLRLLAVAGVFRIVDDNCANNEGSERLRSAHPLSVRAFCQLAAGDYQRAFTELRHTVTHGTPSTTVAFGQSLYEHLAADPRAAAVYHGAMDDLTRGVGTALARAFDWSGVRSVVDVGGGTGRLLADLLAVHPHLDAICFDRPGNPLAAAATRAPQGRLRFEHGDFFAAVPSGADVYVLKNVVHNWADREAEHVLRVVGTSLVTPTAWVLLLEPADEGEASMFAALDALMQAVVCAPGSGPRTASQLDALVRAAGLAVETTSTLASGHRLVAARRHTG